MKIENAFISFPVIMIVNIQETKQIEKFISDSKSLTSRVNRSDSPVESGAVVKLNGIFQMASIILFGCCPSISF